MREIEFRAWDGEQYVYQSDCHSFNLGGPHGNELLAWLGFDLIGSVEVEAVEQYTGLKDCEGRKIFEGDIIQSYSFTDYKGEKNNLIHQVVWSDANAMWVAANARSDEPKSLGDGNCMMMVYQRSAVDAKIIGNIHENPELLAK